MNRVRLRTLPSSCKTMGSLEQHVKNEQNHPCTVPKELAHARLQSHDGVVRRGAKVEPAVVESKVLSQTRERPSGLLHGTQHVRNLRAMDDSHSSVEWRDTPRAAAVSSQTDEKHNNRDCDFPKRERRKQPKSQGPCSTISQSKTSRTVVPSKNSPYRKERDVVGTAVPARSFTILEVRRATPG